MKPVNSTFIQSMVAIMAIFMSVQLTYSQSCITCDNNNIKAGFGNAVNSAYSNQSILGNGNTTGRNNAVAIGTASQANWSHSYVFGSSSVTNGMHAYAIGSNAVAQSTSSFAIGNYAKSMFGNAHSIGNFTTSNQVGAYVFGLGISDVYPLINTTTNSLVVGFKSQYPTLFVSETASGDQSGRVGIGNVTDPQAKLHIRADDGEDASLRLEPTGSTKNAVVYFTNSGHAVKAKTGGHLTFSTQSTKGFVFEAGNVGIGVATPVEKLDIAGNIKQSAGSSLTTTTVKAADANGLKLYNSSGSGMFVAANGSVGIGTTNTLDYMLAVAGKVVATEVFVKHIDNWYDHVFSESYDLMSIHALEQYVKENKHLPDMPTENDVTSDGIQIGSIAGLLLKKIEELTLYTIEQQNLIEEQQKVLERVLETLEKDKSKQ